MTTQLLKALRLRGLLPAPRYASRFTPSVGLLLAAGIVLLIVVLMTAITVLDVRQTRSDARNSLLESGTQLAMVAGSVLPGPLKASDLKTLGEFSSALWAQRDVSYAKIFDAEGRLLVGPGEDQFPSGVRDTSFLRDPEVQKLHTVFKWTPEGLDVIAPVSSGAQLAGVVEFGFDNARVDDEVHDLTIERLWQTLALVCLGVVGSLVLSNFFAGPIRSLVRANQKLSEGDLSSRVRELRGREMHELGDSFNRMADQLQNKVQELQESRARIVESEERTRREIAADLHGPVQGGLLALSAQIDAVRRQNGMGPEQARSLEGITEEMRRIIHTGIAVRSRQLYPDIVKRGLAASLQSLFDQFEGTLNLTLELPPELTAAERARSDMLPEKTRLAAYRIALEALTNAVKHAADSNVVIRVQTPVAGWLTLLVADDGPGFDLDRIKAGLSLTAMQDYAAAVGGTCSVTTAPGRGTRVEGRLPLSETGA